MKSMDTVNGLYTSEQQTIILMSVPTSRRQSDVVRGEAVVYTNQTK